MKIQLKPVAAAVALALAASPVYAITYHLAAKAYVKTMPDGTTVPMWGYVLDPDGADGNTTGDCYQIANNGNRATCIANLPDPEPQGPQLTVPVGVTNVVIRLSNELPEPTSLIIPGQELPNVNVIGTGVVSGPTWDGGTTGARTNANQRVRSFVAEAPANGRAAFRWTNGLGNPITGSGTSLYHSGTHPQKQVYMGLAGLITQDAAVGEAYPGVSYNSEATLFYSDIDPAFNTAVSGGSLTTAIDRHPIWFLVNGEPYEAGVTTPIPAGDASENVLLRLASTATDTHVAVLQGLNMSIHAEDGQQYNYQEGAAIMPAPRVQYSAMLPPAKTKDAIVVAPLEGNYAVYDGNGYMTNPSEPSNEAVGDEVGGMLRFLAFGMSAGNQAPTANNDAGSVVEGFAITINVLGNDTDPEDDLLSIASFDTTPGLTCDGPTTQGGTCTYTAAPASAPATVTFNYSATDGINSSNAALVTVTVTENQVPTAGDDTATADVGGAMVVINVLANDNDPEGQLALVASGPTATTLGGSVTCTATDCQYTPPATGAGGTDSFIYNVTDGVNPDVPASVTVTVVAPNLVPTANDDPTTPGDPAFSTGINTQLTGIDVLGNDTDADGPSPLTIESFDATGTAGGTVTCVTGVATGTCTYTPATDYVGADTFTYTVTDGADTDVATVTITVNPAEAPVLYFSTNGAGSVPGVAGPYDDADVYTVDANGVFSRLLNASPTGDDQALPHIGLPNNANIDGISVNGTDIYVSFAASSTSVPGVGNVPDEDVVVWNGSTWSAYFDGSYCGLDTSNGQDIDALAVSGGTLYFSTRSGGNGNPIGGVAGPYDDADVYSWNGGTTGAANCDRALDASTVGLPGNADIDGLTVAGSTYHMSFNRNGGTLVPNIGNVQDEAVVSYDSGTDTWSDFRDNGELSTTNSQDVDAIHVP